MIPNYRRIGILSNFSKVFEQVLYSAIYNHVKNYISPQQHGFVSGRSTVTNLATVTQYLAEKIDNRGHVDIIYTDFSRAFDTIQHILLHKLSYFGLTDSALALIRSYLYDRVAYVFYNGYASSEFIVASGVPQGSNLGPLLFTLFINDLLLQLSCPALAYADDVKLYHEISSVGNMDLLQLNLNRIIQWCERFLLDR
ncbi:hypothetical protein Zmor_006351 [Zophobas morio]|uniref:Reverse transcriptase domain-containing protein n=1 Tax=Zophobas morio TaxID=2755281 RepID=A0AA38IUP6_9CUCU|nr:hypothetical protein Zmor_006351 [Zophobas morio]